MTDAERLHEFERRSTELRRLAGLVQEKAADLARAAELFLAAKSAHEKLHHDFMEAHWALYEGMWPARVPDPPPEARKLIGAALDAIREATRP